MYVTSCVAERFHETGWELCTGLRRCLSNEMQRRFPVLRIMLPPAHTRRRAVELAEIAVRSRFGDPAWRPRRTPMFPTWDSIFEQWERAYCLFHGHWQPNPRDYASGRVQGGLDLLIGRRAVVGSRITFASRLDDLLVEDLSKFRV